MVLAMDIGLFFAGIPIVFVTAAGARLVFPLIRDRGLPVVDVGEWWREDQLRIAVFIVALAFALGLGSFASSAGADVAWRSLGRKPRSLVAAYRCRHPPKPSNATQPAKAHGGLAAWPAQRAF